MKLIKKKQRQQMLENWPKETAGQHAGPPVLKLFSPAGAATWLITSMDPEDEDTMFGLCDLGMGFPEMGYVSLSELQSVELNVRMGPHTIPVRIERDMYFRATHPLRVYAEAARHDSGITQDEGKLAAAADRVAQRDAREEVAAAAQAAVQGGSAGSTTTGGDGRE